MGQLGSACETGTPYARDGWNWLCQTASVVPFPQAKRGEGKRQSRSDAFYYVRRAPCEYRAGNPWPREQTRSWGWSSSSWMMRLPMTTASATLPMVLGRGRIANPKTHARGNAHMLAYAGNASFDGGCVECP